MMVCQHFVPHLARVILVRPAADPCQDLVGVTWKLAPDFSPWGFELKIAPIGP